MSRAEEPFRRQGRFVILLHDVAGSARASGLTRTSSDHFDWMFQAETGLRTWAVSVTEFDAISWRPGTRPMVPSFTRLIAEQLPDHRTAYLEYEGPVSENRGTVKRVEVGDYRLEKSGSNDFVLRLRFEHHRRRAETRWLRIFRDEADTGRDLDGGDSSTLPAGQRIREPRSSSRSTIAWRLDFWSG